MGSDKIASPHLLDVKIGSPHLHNVSFEGSLTCWMSVLRVPAQYNMRSTDTSLVAPRAWAVLLAKTSRRAVPTAIMPIIAGGRLYKYAAEMHVDSRAVSVAF